MRAKIQSFFSCASSVGRSGGKQVVSIGEGCRKKGIVIHELLHSLGFWHEQSRPDRDDYVTIIWANVQEKAKMNFSKFTWAKVRNLIAEYDWGKLVHNKAFFLVIAR